jgi:hypothetical protein
MRLTRVDNLSSSEKDGKYPHGRQQDDENYCAPDQRELSCLTCDRAQASFAGAGLPGDVDSVGWDELVAYGQALEYGSKWRLGELAAAIAGSAKYGEGKLKQYAAEIGIAYSTLRDYRRVAETYPKGGCVERSTHPWSVSPDACQTGVA